MKKVNSPFLKVTTSALLLGFLWGGAGSCQAVAQTAIDISGRVTDSLGQPVQGAIVLVKILNKRDTTGPDGRYAIQDPPVTAVRSIPPDAQTGPGLRLSKGTLQISVPVRQNVSVRLFDVSGRTVFNMPPRSFEAGMHVVVGIDRRLPPDLLLARINGENSVSTVALFGTGTSASDHVSGVVRATANARLPFAVNDTIAVTCRMYRSEILPIAAYSGKFDVTLNKWPKSMRIAGMRYIAGAKFTMGDTGVKTETPASPVHQVTLSAFYIDTTIVTQADYQNIMGTNPSAWSGRPNNPVEEVSWFDAALYCNARSKKDGCDTVYLYTGRTVQNGKCSAIQNLKIRYTVKGYRLPTEAEHEYACRGGTTTRYYWGTTPNLNYFWCGDNANGSTNPVATKKPNGFGLYDMIGNCWQWCNDWFGAYSAQSQTDPTGPESNPNGLVVLRSGSWHQAQNELYLTCAGRNVHGIQAIWDNNLSFRCVFPDR